MSEDEFHVTSEIYLPKSVTESNDKPSLSSENVVTAFYFTTPPATDEDGDLVVRRRNEDLEVISIEHSPKTSLRLVGRQVWRGALLLADFLLHQGTQLSGQTILEVGSGVGLTSIVAAKLAQQVVCTDVDLGGILDLIRANIARNGRHISANFHVLGLDFLADEWPTELVDKIKEASIVIAADVIYDNDLTEAFVKTLVKILSYPPTKTFYIALEKRYVFTMEALDSVAPCYEHFLEKMEEARRKTGFTMRQLPIDFSQYFQYDRIKQLVLWEIRAN